MSNGIIRVLVVEDSPLMCKVLTNILNADPRILVAGVAHDGKEAVEIVPWLKPDVITMDIHMPRMDGLEATKQIMAYNPTPILVVSASIFKVGMDKVFKAISYGALDVIEKGQMEVARNVTSGTELLEKVKFLSGIKVIRHPLAKLKKVRKPIGIPKISKQKDLDKIVAIVASTGGPQALHSILKGFPDNFPCGVVIVQHIPSSFIGGLADWLNSESQVEVKVAEDSEEIRPGVVYLAPADLQMRTEEEGMIRLSNDPALNGYMPSGDVLLESVARAYKENAIGVILTGMGKDGAGGIKTIKEMNGMTIAQDEKSCIVFGMPKVAIEMDVIDKVLSYEKIAEEIVKTLIG